MDWTRRATINEQTDGTTANKSIVINFLPMTGPGINIKERASSRSYADRLPYALLGSLTRLCRSHLNAPAHLASGHS